MTGDPRQADADAAQALMDQVERDGAVQLPALSTAELCVLGAMQATLIDEVSWSWWSGMTEAERFGLSAMALKFLVHRGLLDEPEPGAIEDVSTENVDLPARPLLAMILAGRTQPAFVVIRAEGAKAAPERTRLYGIAEEGRGLRAVLAETGPGKLPTRFGPAYEYALVSPAEAVNSLLRWVNRAPAGHKLGRRRPKIIDVYQPNKGAGPARDRFEVHRGGPSGLRVEQGSTDSSGTSAPIDCDEDAFGRLLTDLFTRQGNAA
ncbi:hypothetical protein [Streptomyces sp. NBC_00078]|uniref:hypothetical protein n=1 Tax=unclassified Streptomyces TaxID=2593676 RepID=UPI00225B3F8C|nr:hypothetical protein [Streptomyces sp. NBC_00078]MCX5422883.1 hypothetical protein [Streptomyces sp. NBC_00078]